MAHHRTVNAAIQAKYALTLPQYVLDPVNLDDPDAFLYQHQIMHNNTDALLGIASYDLTSADFSSPETMAAWIFLNATLHYAEATALGTW